MFEQRNIKRLFLKTKKQTKDFLLSAKSREFFVFLCFFFIAAGFWLLQTLNNDYETEFSIPVRLRNVPENVVITSEPVSEVRVRVRDKGTVLLNYMLGKNFYPVILDFKNYINMGNHVQVQTSQVQKWITGQLNASTALLSMKSCPHRFRRIFYENGTMGFANILNNINSSGKSVQFGAHNKFYIRI